MSNHLSLPEYYRSQAAHLRKMAEEAVYPEIRDSYLRVAHKWESMAAHHQAQAPVTLFVGAKLSDIKIT